MAKRIQIVVAVDVDKPVADGDLLALVPHERDERVLVRLTECGAPRLQRFDATPQPIDWPRLAQAVENVAVKIQEVSTNEAIVDVYVGGFAPLSVFVHLGYALSRFAGQQTFLHWDAGGHWQSYPLLSAPSDTQDSTFDELVGLGGSPSASTAQTAVYIDLNTRVAPVEAIQRAHEGGGLSLGSIVEIRTTTPKRLSAENSGRTARQLVQELARVPSFFPRASGTTLFLAVPAPVAFMVGRAINPTIFQSVLLTDYYANVYEIVATLPHADQDRSEISLGNDDVRERALVEVDLGACVVELQRGVARDDFPSEDLGTRIFERLRSLELVKGTTSEFALSVSQGKLCFGVTLLEALRRVDRDQRRQFVQLLVLHELFHTEQGLRSTNYNEVGRAGVVLEHVDFAADAFALKVVTARAFREYPTSDACATITPWFEAVVLGISVFDRRIDPVRMRNLPERRLRRYLTWCLQLARAKTVTSREHASRLLSSQIAAELAPLAGKLSARHDKIVIDAVPETEFFCVVDGRLIRRHNQGAFDPRQLVEAVRCYNREVVESAMHAIVEENTHLLAPWRP